MSTAKRTIKRTSDKPRSQAGKQARTSRTSTASKKRPASKRPGAAALRALLATAPPQVGESRTDFSHTVEGEGLALEAVVQPLTFIAAVSHDGPWELRSLVINDFQVLNKTVPTTGRRIDVPIPAVFGTNLKVSWAILAGHAIPSAGTFIEPQGQQAVPLDSKGPLKKGESWAPLLPASFPKA
jgi:hypothetical protein